ncbi:TatD DNase family protein [Bacilli bacterium PM5-3]|nr:TatD DNase family protein [Bacilli bacterium PM5-3]MDH6603267.1 TatD DNase family protein [Bacilli bacterium PM5-9]
MKRSVLDMGMLFDTHVHLNGKPFIEDIENVVKTSQKNGIKKMVCIGYDMQSSLLAIDLAYRFPNVIYAAIGIHPNDCNDISDDDLKRLEAMLDEPCVVALGEIGLDYHWDTVKPEVQKEFFIKQIEMAKRKNKPIIIHSREATKDTYDILKQQDISKIGGVMHSYSSSNDMAKEFIKLNMMISISGVITFNNARRTKEVAKDIPLDKLLIETDCPYLTPVPYRGKTNYPEYTYYVAQEIASQKDMDIDGVIEQTYKNACQFFKIAE